MGFRAMKIISTQARMQHPEASLIPEKTWKLDFQQEITDDEIRLLKTDKSDLAAVLSDIYHASDYSNEKKRRRLLLAIIIKHPDIEAERLLNFATELALDAFPWVIFTALECGNERLLEELVKNKPVKFFHGRRGFMDACIARADLKLIEYLLNHALRTGYTKEIFFTRVSFPNVVAQNEVDFLNGIVNLMKDHHVNLADSLLDNQSWINAVDSRNANIQVFNRLLALSQEYRLDIKQILCQEYDHIISKAVKGGNQEIIERIVKLYIENNIDIKALIKSRIICFRELIKNGNLELVRYFMSVLGTDGNTDLLLNQLSSAVGSGQVDKVEQFLAFCREYGVEPQVDAECIVQAAINNDLTMCNYLVEMAEAKRIILEDIITVRALDSPVRAGNLTLLNRLIELVPNKIHELMTADHFDACRVAIIFGKLDVFKRLITFLTPDEIRLVIAKNNFEPFSKAASSGYLEMINFLITLAPEETQNMVRGLSGEFIDRGRVHVFKRLLELAPEQVYAIIEANNYRAVERACSNKHTEMARLTFQHPGAFAQAESHDHEYGTSIIHPFVDETLSALHLKHDEALERDPRHVFNIENENHAKLYFFILRNLIRRSLTDTTLLNEIRFLLSIPAVKTLVHTAVRPNQPNELLRLALTLGNAEAASILLAIPAVFEQAAADHYYIEERAGRLDLRQLAQDRESSMTALSTSEQKRLQRAIDHYGSRLKDAEGRSLVSEIMVTLQDDLRARYSANPASILRDDEHTPLQLPLEWTGENGFEAMLQNFGLSDPEKKRAFEAYYQHQAHTVLRYLSRPNYWINQDALYVNVNPNNTAEKWSTFEEYQPLIAMLYLAASDRDIPAIDGFMFETRLEHFYDELAHIGRAHNWDNTRFIMDKEGAPVLDDDGKPVTEEFDDFTGDRPSCYSGVKRRLFQSVLGHILLKMLTPQMVTQELYDFVREHFQSQINPGNLQGIHDEFNNQIIQQLEGETPYLKAMDITPALQEGFIASMRDKYGEQFDAELVMLVFRKFNLTEAGITHTCHVAKFAGWVDIDGLLKQAADSFFRTQLIQDLKNYVKSVHDGARPRFTFFKARQSANREINCTLAEELCVDLENNRPINEVFQNIYNKRDKIREKHPKRPIGNFLLSNELNEIIKRGQLGGLDAQTTLQPLS